MLLSKPIFVFLPYQKVGRRPEFSRSRINKEGTGTTFGAGKGMGEAECSESNLEKNPMTGTDK